MSNVLVVNVMTEVKRVALIEGGVTTEFYLEHGYERGLVGNIYKGTVVRILPGMQAAFVNIGLERTAFLYVTDVGKPLTLDDDVGEILDGDDDLVDMRKRRIPPRGWNIEELLTENQEVIVQVAREPIGSKGARITTNISLPGRQLVFLPTVDHVGVSRRIEDEEERERLRRIAESMKPSRGGIIVRTVAEGKTDEDFQEDLTFLTELWSDIQQRADVAIAPSLIYEDLDIILRSARDLVTNQCERVIIDDQKHYEQLGKFIARFMPHYKGTIQLYDESEPLFERYGVELEVSRALERKVWLKSGGYIVVDQTEALTAIDVNTGKYTGKSNPEETILKTNLEAVREIVYQLRLRNIGGIIIVDFIDMESEEHREKVHQTLSEELRRDKAKTNVLPMSRLGLVEMTRKRVRESLGRLLTEPCFYCDGRGYLKSARVMCREILAKIRKQIRNEAIRSLHISAHPRITEMLFEDAREALDELEQKYKKALHIHPRDDLHLEQYKIMGRI